MDFPRPSFEEDTRSIKMTFERDDVQSPLFVVQHFGQRPEPKQTQNMICENLLSFVFRGAHTS